MKKQSKKKARELYLLMEGQNCIANFSNVNLSQIEKTRKHLEQIYNRDVELVSFKEVLPRKKAK